MSGVASFVVPKLVSSDGVTRSLIAIGVLLPGLMLLGGLERRRLEHLHAHGRARLADHLRPVGVLVAGLILTAFTAQMLFPAIAPVWIAVAGFYLFRIGRGRRQGLSRHCAKCDYEFSNVPAAPDHCPECGHAWLRGNGLSRGKLVRRPWLAWTGGLLMAGVIVTGTALVGGRAGTVVGHLPTSVLATQAANYRIGAYSIWNELGQRTLSVNQMRRLATAVLDDRRTDDPSLSLAAHIWLDTQQASGALTPDLLERYFVDSFRPRLIGPRSAKVGETVVLKLGAPRSQMGYSIAVGQPFSGTVGAPLIRAYVIATEASVNGSVTPPACGGPFLEVLGSSQIEYFGGADGPYATSMLSRAPSVTLVPEKAGTTSVRVKCWVFYSPTMLAAVQASRDETGRVLLPTSTVWSREINIEHSIEVAPSDR